MLSLGLWFILILLDILLIANIYVCDCVYVHVLTNTEGKRRSSDVTAHIRRLLGLSVTWPNRSMFTVRDIRRLLGLIAWINA